MFKVGDKVRRKVSCNPYDSFEPSTGEPVLIAPGEIGTVTSLSPFDGDFFVDNANLNTSCDLWELVSENTNSKTKPNYYKAKSGRDVMDVIVEFDLDFFQGNVLKYIIRYRGKNGLEDLQKAKEYIDRMIKRLEDENGRQ